MGPEFSMETGERLTPWQWAPGNAPWTHSGKRALEAAAEVPEEDPEKRSERQQGTGELKVNEPRARPPELATHLDQLARDEGALDGQEPRTPPLPEPRAPERQGYDAAEVNRCLLQEDEDNGIIEDKRIGFVPIVLADTGGLRNAEHERYVKQYLMETCPHQ